MPDIIIYHNPACGTSRGTLEIIRAAGHEPAVIEYLKNPPDRKTLTGLLGDMKMSAHELLRVNVEPYETFGLADSKWTEEQLIDSMLLHPILINRPVVVTPRGTRLCRPKEKVLELL